MENPYGLESSVSIIVLFRTVSQILWITGLIFAVDGEMPLFNALIRADCMIAKLNL